MFSAFHHNRVGVRKSYLQRRFFSVQSKRFYNSEKDNANHFRDKRKRSHSRAHANNLDLSNSQSKFLSIFKFLPNSIFLGFNCSQTWAEIDKLLSIYSIISRNRRKLRLQSRLQNSISWKTRSFPQVYSAIFGEDSQRMIDQMID